MLILTRRISEALIIGDEIEVPDDEGRRMIAKGQAKEIKQETKSGNAQRQ